MITARTPEGILAWFSFDRPAGRHSLFDVFVGEETLGREGVLERLRGPRGFSVPEIPEG